MWASGLEIIDRAIFVGVPVIVAIVTAIIAERMSSSVLSKFAATRQLPQSALHLMKTFVRWIIIIIVVLGVASIIGISLESLWVAVSAIIAMSLVGFFASWSLLSNTLAALVIMIWRPFEVGDRIEILPDKIVGEVTDINLMFSRVTTEDGEVVNVPNNTFLSRYVKQMRKR